MKYNALILNRTSLTPLYKQLELFFEKQILEGKLPFQASLPQEDELCQLFDISLFVVKKAFSELQKKGLIERAKRKGSVVAYRPIVRTKIQNAIFFDTYSGNGKPSYDIITINIASLESKAFSLLDASPQETILAVKRLVTFGVSPVCFQTIYLRKSIYDQIYNEIPANFCFENLLKLFPNQEVSINHQFSSINIEKWMSGILQVASDDAGHLVTSVITESLNRPIVVIDSIFPGHFVQWEVERI
jgi:DNA-binding GntR family transcriptional regulator